MPRAVERRTGQKGGGQLRKIEQHSLNERKKENFQTRMHKEKQRGSEKSTFEGDVHHSRENEFAHLRNVRFEIGFREILQPGIPSKRFAG